MKRALGIIGLSAVLGVGGYMLVAAGKKEVRPPESAQNMQFPMGFDVTGDPFDGSICHEVWQKMKDGSRVLLKSHRIMGKDFRTATLEQKKQWIIEDTLEDYKDTGRACGPVDQGLLFHNAFADPPTCLDCGGGCLTVTCPAHITQLGHCALGGGNCVITILCCSGGCGC